MPHPTTSRPSCVYPECPKPALRLTGKMAGYCHGHRQQIQQHQPLRPLQPRTPVGLSLPELAAYVERERVVKLPNGCWEYQGCLNEHGYGKIGFQGRDVRVHRLMLMAQGIKLTPSQFVLHRCDNPPCVRPEHLYVGTQKDNLRDAIVRGRRKDRKLSLLQAQEIRERYAAGGIPQQTLADEYRVDRRAIANILHHKTYRF